jgi:hypothetical protein
LALVGAVALAGLLAACGTVSAAGNAGAASATATCPPTPSFSSVSGAITAVSGNSLTVKASSGATTTLALDSTTRVSLTQNVPASSLTQGTPVLVLTDTNATEAKSIRVVAATGTGTGSGGFGGGFGGGRFGNGTPNPNRTPRAGFNSACARQFAGGNGSGFGGTSATGFQGLRGTVDSATTSNITFDDATGQTYSVAITSSTTITKTADGKVTDLKVGQNVLVAASKTNGQEIARTVTVNE